MNDMWKGTKTNVKIKIWYDSIANFKGIFLKKKTFYLIKITCEIK